MQTKLPCHMCPKSWTALWRSRKLYGQCEVLWLLWIPLSENCKLICYIKSLDIYILITWEIYHEINRCYFRLITILQNKKFVKTVPAYRPSSSSNSVFDRISDDERNSPRSTSSPDQKRGNLDSEFVNSTSNHASTKNINNIPFSLNFVWILSHFILIPFSTFHIHLFNFAHPSRDWTAFIIFGGNCTINQISLQFMNIKLYQKNY